MVISCLTGLTFTTSASATYTAVLDGATPYATVKDALDTITDTANHEITLIADTDEEIVIPEKRDITLDLNNHVLSGKESAEGPIIFVNIVMCKLTIKDGSDNKTPKYFNVDEQTGVWTLAEDQSTPTEYSVLGGCITGAKRYSESECNKGGAIFNSGTLVVKDIAIVGNEANMGAAIYNEAWTGNLTLDGAVIAGNYADIGAGIDSRHDATIKNTTIAENKAVECAGLFANGSTTIGDGTIIKNNTTTDSYPSAGAYLYHTNEWDATMMLTGDVVIKDNKSAGNDANLCLQNEVVTLDSLSSTSQIGVSVLDDNEALTSGKFASGTKGDAMRLTPDNSSYSISRDSSTNDISLLLSLGTCGAEGNESNVTWDFDYTTGTLTISGTGAMVDFAYGDNTSAFRPLKDLVKKVVIADGVASIGEFAFYGYTNLTELSIGKNVLNIYGSAFENTGLTSLYVPKNVVSISEKAFYNATKLNSITFENENLACGSSNQFMGTAYAKNNANWSDGIMYVGTSAVQFDKTRVDGNVITFKPDTTATFLEKGYIEEISVQGFEIAETNQKYKTVNGVLYSKDGKTLIRFPGSVTGEFVIPEGVNNIGQTAFERTKLSKVTTPSTTKKIHSFVFEKSTSLTDVIIKGDVEEIEIMLFYECTALKNISLPATVKNVLMGAFYDCNALENIYFDGSMALAQKIKISTMMNTPFTLDKFKVLFDDKLDGVVNMSNYKTWTHYPYTLKGWYDEKGSLLVGDASYFQSYTAKWLNEYGNEVVDKAIDFFDLPTTDMMDTQGWKWDSATKTLTLNNATFDCSGIYKKESTPAIELPDGATVVSETDSVNTIIGPVSDAQSVGIWATGEVTFVGDGTINVKTSNEKKANTALLAFGNVTVKDEMKLVLCKGKDVGVFKAISLDLRGESTELTLNDKATITAYNRITCEYEYGLGNYFITGEKDGERTRTYGRDSIKDFYEECIVIYRAGTLSETGLYKYGGGGGGATRPATVKKDEEQKVEETDTEETIVGAKKLELIIGSKVIDVDGKTVENDVAPLIRNDRTMLPARFVAENLGATVEWDEEQQKVTITSADKKTVITLVIGLPVIFVTDTTAKEGATKELELECAPFIENDRTYTPLRAIAEALGAKVEWEEATQKVTISR